MFNKIIVSTDSNKIANLSKKYGADHVISRNKELSKDHIGAYQIVLDVIKKIKQKNIFPSHVFCIFPTSVFVKKKHLLSAIKKLNEKNSSFIFSAIKYPHPIQRSFVFKRGKLTTNFSKYKKIQTQKINSSFFDAGQFYLAKPEKWLKFDNVFQKDSSIIEMQHNECKDIDEIGDWKLAELIFKAFKNKI
jgi:N-acylneuraminate cytidylyltransferase